MHWKKRAKMRAKKRFDAQQKKHRAKKNDVESNQIQQKEILGHNFFQDEIARAIEILPSSEAPSEKDGIKYFAYSENGSLQIIFFVGKNYDEAGKRGKAVFFPVENSWRVYEVNGKSTLKRTRAGKGFGQIVLAQQNGIWRATLITNTLQTLQKGEGLRFGIFQDTPIQKEEEFFTGDKEVVFKKSVEKAVETAISGLHSSASIH